MTDQNNGTEYLFTLTSFEGDGDRVAAPLVLANTALAVGGDVILWLSLEGVELARRGSRFRPLWRVIAGSRMVARAVPRPARAPALILMTVANFGSIGTPSPPRSVTDTYAHRETSYRTQPASGNKRRDISTGLNSRFPARRYEALPLCGPHAG